MGLDVSLLEREMSAAGGPTDRLHVLLFSAGLYVTVKQQSALKKRPVPLCMFV